MFCTVFRSKNATIMMNKYGIMMKLTQQLLYGYRFCGVPTIIIDPTIVNRMKKILAQNDELPGFKYYTFEFFKINSQ